MTEANFIDKQDDSRICHGVYICVWFKLAHQVMHKAVQQPKSLETQGNAVVAPIITAPSVQTAMALDGKPLLAAARA